MKKVVVKLDLHDDKAKQKALKRVSTLAGIDSIAMDMKDKKLTVVGDVDPVKVVSKLSKTWFTEIVSVGPAKEEKKDEGKKDEGKKDEGKKDEGKKDGGKKDDKDKQSAELINDFKAFNPYMTQYYHVHNSSMEENPNACVIF